MSGRGQCWSEGSQLFILKLISVICSTDWLYSLQSLFKSYLVDLSSLPSQLPPYYTRASYFYPPTASDSLSLLPSLCYIKDHLPGQGGRGVRGWWVGWWSRQFSPRQWESERLCRPAVTQLVSLIFQSIVIVRIEELSGDQESESRDNLHWSSALGIDFVQ